MFERERAQLSSTFSLAAGVSLSMLSERVHRGSLANARAAITTGRERDLGSLPTWSQDRTSQYQAPQYQASQYRTSQYQAPPPRRVFA
ncbi:MAG: hypothetical protein ACT4PP_16815 [Sporichthyaceae bacterium]